MRPFLCAHATHPEWALAAAWVLTQLRAQLQERQSAPPEKGAAADGVARTEPEVPPLGVVYITDAYAAHAQDLLDVLMDALPEVTDWVGTVGVGIAASGVEYFDEPAMAIMLMDIDPSQYRVFSGVAPLPAPVPGASAVHEPGFTASTALVHVDGSTPDVAGLVSELAQRTASGYVFGGLSSGRGRHVQFAHSSRGSLAGQGHVGGVVRGGLSGVAFGPGVDVVSRVTQGCVPVGPVRTLTHSDGHLALTLDGLPAMDTLLDDLAIAPDLPPNAFPKLRRTLVGLSDPVEKSDASPTGHPGPGRGWARHAGQLGSQVRVRHLVGLDPVRRGVAIADHLEDGCELVFCERNPEAARADLMRMCTEIREDLESPDRGDLAEPSGSPARAVMGAIYVSCAGRGGPHFGQPHAELQWVRRALGDVPLVGFFASGEIAHRQLYGYTGVLTVFVGPVP